MAKSKKKQQDQETIELSGENPVCISFSSQVDQRTAPVLLATLTEAVNERFDEIHLFISSPGGTVNDGICIYNSIKALPVPVITYNMSSIDSIANVLYQAGQRRICAETSSFMFHGVGFEVQNARMELKDIKERKIGIENDQSKIASIMERHTPLDRAAIDDLFLQMAYMSAEEALERGITDEIRQVRLPHGLPIRQLVFQ